MAKKKGLVKAGSTALSTFVEELRKEALDVGSREVLTAPRISFEGGAISIAGTDVPINRDRSRYEIPVIIADFTNEKSFYLRPYSKDDPQTPACWAFGDEEKHLTPLKINPGGANGFPEKDSVVGKLQSQSCAVCPHNVFGTADQGDGKRCKDVRRLLCLPANLKVEQVPKAEALIASIPATSLNNWKKYVKGLKAAGLPVTGIRTLMYVEKYKSAYVIQFEPCGPDFNPVTDLSESVIEERMYRALKARKDGLREALFSPYPIINEGEAKPKVKKPSKTDKAKASKRAKKVS